MKKVSIILALLIVILGIFALSNKKEKGNKADNKLKIVTTTTMITDLIKEIGKDKVQVEGLMGAGVDPHLYKASEGDVAKLSNAQVVIYSGLHLEGKMEEIFEKMKHRDKKVYALTDIIDKSELIESANFASNYDPHVWFGTQIWKEITVYAGELLSEVDPKNSEFYKQNAKDYVRKIEDFDKYAIDKINTLPKEQRILITAHDAFNYFGKKYGFQVLGLQGISTATEAGVQDVKKLADFIYKNKIRAVFVESSVPKRNVEALQKAVKARGFNVEIGGELYSDALGDPGTVEGTYIGMYRHNLDTIVNALSGKK